MAPPPSLVMTLLAETSLHPGTGQSVGAIDLPIQRERHTGFPVIQASSLKGSLRAAAEKRYGNSPDIVTAIFGPDDKPDHAGALQVCDARLLALPVRALQQVFVWVTCPLVLARLRRDVAFAGLTSDLPIPDVTAGPEHALVAAVSLLTDGLVLEDMRFTVEASRLPDNLVTTMTGLAPQQIGCDWTKRLAVIADDDFAYLVTHTTPVAAHVQLTAGKTTGKWPNPITGKEDPGNFWYEETLPPEALLYAVLIGGKPKDAKRALSGPDDVLAKTREVFTGERGPYLHVGGNLTTGEGWCGLRFVGGPS